ncbi:UNVERIFIED_CONTAM: hypothetical protein FKN15_002072 [Acipenser sinensis]
MGFLMRVPSNQVRIQICDSIVSFYKPKTSKQHVEGFLPTNPSYKVQMAEQSGLAETLVLSLALLENQFEVKLRVLQALQMLSGSSEINCSLMLKAEAASKLCSRLNDRDPSGELLFLSSEILWNLLEKGCKEEVTSQLCNLDCINALKEVFLNQLLNGFRHYDLQLRNDLLVIATVITENPKAPMIVIKSHNPLVRSLKLSFKNEDFEMKKLLFNLLVVMSKDLSAIQLFTESKVLLSLFHYVKPNDKPGPRDWSAAQYEELQLHALATLATVAPLLIDDYMTCQGNTRLLLLLEWCVSQDAFFGQGNSFHGTGGRGNKKSQMRYCLRLLRSVVSLSDETVNRDLCDQGALDQLLGFEDLAGLTTEDYVTLAIISRYLDFKLGEVWNEISRELEEEGLRPVTPDVEALESIAKAAEDVGRKVATLQADMLENQQQQDLQDEKRIYTEIQMNHQQYELTNKSWDAYVARTSNYEILKLGEVWNEISRELEEEGLRPVTPDVEALESIAMAAEDVGRKVATLQADMLENQQQQDLQDEKRIYTKIQMNHQQYELTNKSWDAYVARTSNYEILKDCKSLQVKAIESSKPKMRQQDAVFHPIQDTGLHTNFCGRLVTVDSTPAQLTGGPLANTDLALEQVSIRGGALQKTKAAKEMEQYQMGSISVK